MELKIFSGQASLDLTAKICSHLNTALGDMTYRKFSDGEIWVRFEENIRGTDVFLIQSTYSPAEHIWELLLMIDAAKRASAARICVVLPYYGYARQDRKDESRVPISAKLKADLISAAGAHRVLAMDLHAGQIQGFFNIPMDHIYAKPVFIEYFVKYLRNELLGPLTVLSPDVGANKIARSYAKRLENSPIAIIDKRRPEPNLVEVLSIIGETKERSVLIIDDIIDTGGTLTESAKKAKQHGAKQKFLNLDKIFLDCYSFGRTLIFKKPTRRRFEMVEGDYLILEFEMKLGEAQKLKEKIDNPEPDRLLAIHRQMEKEYQQLMTDGKTMLYLAAKEIIEKRFNLFHLTDKNEVCYLQGWSHAGHPVFCYADESGFSGPITTFAGRPKILLSSKEFMEKLMRGDYKPLDRLCFQCKKLVPYGDTVCPNLNCGSKL